MVPKKIIEEHEVKKKLIIEPNPKDVKMVGKDKEASLRSENVLTIEDKNLATISNNNLHENNKSMGNKNNHKPINSPEVHCNHPYPYSDFSINSYQTPMQFSPKNVETTDNLNPDKYIHSSDNQMSNTLNEMPNLAPETEYSEVVSRPKSRGKQKIDIKYIIDRTKRLITFSKRKLGCMRKTDEICKLTGAQAIVIVASDSGHIHTYVTEKFQNFVDNNKDEIKNVLFEHFPDKQVQQLFSSDGFEVGSDGVNNLKGKKEKTPHGKFK